MQKLLNDIRNCTICAEHLPLGPRPVMVASPKSKITIIGQAPGTKVHASGIPWDDASGKRLREWMGVTDEEFYNPDIVSIVPMGFCYPGKGKSGDLPPRKECAPKWHEAVFSHMPQEQLILLVGKYAQDYYLEGKKSLTENVQDFEKHLPQFLPLPHPSPRNRAWFKNNPWFDIELVSILKELVQQRLP